MVVGLLAWIVRELTLVAVGLARPYDGGHRPGRHEAAGLS